MGRKKSIRGQVYRTELSTSNEGEKVGRKLEGDRERRIGLVNRFMSNHAGTRGGDGNEGPYGGRRKK